MKSSEYWKKRFQQLEEASHAYGQMTYSQIEPAFDKAQKEIQKEIDAWYARFAANNNVSMQEARKMLSSRELSELKWDIDDYIKYGQQNAVDGKWMKQLENASARFHISRLEALQLRTQQAMEKAFGNELDGVDAMARHLYTDGYYHAAFEIQKGFNIGWNIGQIDERTLDKVITKPWATDGNNFSSRIWSRKDQTINELHQELTRTIVQGKSPDEAIKHMQQFVDKKVKNAKYAAGRLVMTEDAYFHSLSQKDAFNDLDVDEFENVATLDMRTSEICQDMDGSHFPMKDYEPGTTAPPFHPNCRTVTVPYFNDEWSAGERAARDEDGKTYYVSSDMKYPEWKKAFVDGGSKATLKPVAPKTEPKPHTEAYDKIKKSVDVNKVDYNLVGSLADSLTETEIIEKLAGGDKTEGSCSSLALAYIGNKNGLDVTDYRGGKSRFVFSQNDIITEIAKLEGVKSQIVMVEKPIKESAEVLKTLEDGKEYYFATGKHAAMVRKTENGLEYLELQSAYKNGWMPFDDVSDILKRRFGARKTPDKMKIAGKTYLFKKRVVLIDADSLKGNDEFAELLGYLNTATDKQKKGITGHVR